MNKKETIITQLPPKQGLRPEAPHPLGG